MIRNSLTFLFAHLIREIDTHGFVGDFRRLSHVLHPSTHAKAIAAVKHNCNVLFCGHYHTGKLTLLKAIGRHCEKKLNLRVGYVSADNTRAARLDGLLIHHFLGLRLSKDELPSQEQLEGTLQRHIRLVESTYGRCMPSLGNIDVLILDALEKLNPSIILSIDAVSRRERGKPSEAFGGLRVFAAADFWCLPVHPTSDLGGYMFQLDCWDELFPKQTLLRKTHGQDEELNNYVEKALFGTLTLNDIKTLEARSWQNTVPKISTPQEKNNTLEWTVQEQNNVDGYANTTNETRNSELLPNFDTNTNKDSTSNSFAVATNTATAATSPLTYDEMLSSATSLALHTPRFSKQPTIKIAPARLRPLKQTEVGAFLINSLIQSSMPLSFGLVDALSVNVGDRVHLTHDGTAQYGVGAGAIGEVRNIRDHFITVHFPAEHRIVDIPRMGVKIYHPYYPEIVYELRQFPLFPQVKLCPLHMINFPNCYHVHINCRRMTDTNDLGNLLARMRNFNDFTLCNTADFAHLEGMVHEPTRIYYHQLMKKSLSTAPEQWCRNCKSFVPTSEFFNHWAKCIKTVRWCTECDKAIPLELLEPHKEKHLIVLCLDCGRGVEWRHWEAHRISCIMMMREVSADNTFLPLRTRQLALELGLDKRDLHTMRQLSRALLTRLKKERESPHADLQMRITL